MLNQTMFLNPIQGCSNGCKYCLLQGKTGNHMKPFVLVSPKEAVNLLFESKYFNSKIPICLMPGTDPFLNDNNITYLNELLQIFINKKINNPIIIITKCLIPDKTINLLNKLKKKVVYLSYSGLSKVFEPNINHEAIKLNFKKLKENNIKTIHYYRPFLKENSSIKDINELLDFVKKYTDISVITGLKVRTDFISELEFVPIIKTNTQECLDASSIWPKEAYDYFFKNYQHSQNVFQTNYCALAQILEEACPQFYGTYECSNFNHCSIEQRKRCSLYKKEIISDEKIIKLIKKLDIETNDIQIIRDKNKVDRILKENKTIMVFKPHFYEMHKLEESNEQFTNIILASDKLSVADVAYLSRVLNTKISLSKSKNNSFFTNSKPFIY